jgi:hypothetical protein
MRSLRAACSTIAASLALLVCSAVPAFAAESHQVYGLTVTPSVGAYPYRPVLKYEDLNTY